MRNGALHWHRKKRPVLMARALDLTTDRTRLMDHYNALTTNPAKRAEFVEVLREVDNSFASYMWRMIRRIPRGTRCADMTTP